MSQHLYLNLRLGVERHDRAVHSDVPVRLQSYHDRHVSVRERKSKNIKS